jgi:hypothetical protein
MKRAAVRAVLDTLQIEEDEALRHQLRVASDVAEKNYAKKARDDQRKQLLTSWMNEWQLMGLKSAEGCSVTMPRSTPHLGTLCCDSHDFVVRFLC